MIAISAITLSPPATAKLVLRELEDDGIVVLSGRVEIVSGRVTVERAMSDREQEQLLATATDRFERRLSEEVANLRDGDAAIRLEIANLRIEMSEQDSATRLELARLRLDMSEQRAADRQQNQAQHRELLKWALMLWIAQAAATAGLVSALT